MFCAACRVTKGQERAAHYIAQAIGDRYQNATLGDFEGHFKRTPSQIAQELAEIFKSGRNLYIYGNLGKGKTHFAAAMLRFYGMNFISPTKSWYLYLRGKDLADMEKTEPNHYEDFVKSPLIIIDELVTPGEYRAERLFLFVDERYSHCRPTIGISNYSAEQIQSGESQLGADFGPKIISRLTRDTGAAIWEIK